jgi:hypothetical protein
MATTAPVYLLVLGGLWLLGRNARALPVYDQIAFAVMSVVAFQAIRNIAWIALVALAVLPPLIDRLRSPVEEPKRLNRILALVIIGSAVVSLAGVAAKPTSWFTHNFPTGTTRAVADAAGQRGRVFATSPYADWVLWSDSNLSGRVAFDTRFELLLRKQLAALGRVEDAAGDWRKSLREYSVFVLGRKNDDTLEHALRRDLGARVVFSSPQVVVLRRRG